VNPDSHDWRGGTPNVAKRPGTHHSLMGLAFGPRVVHDPIND
jgi:hypothetical protein